MDSIIKIIKSKEDKNVKLSKILKVIINNCNINNDKYFLLGSYAIRKHREINDLDINMDRNEFIKLSKAPYGKLEFYNGQIRWFFDLTKKYNKYTKSNVDDFSIEIFQKNKKDGYPNNNFSLDYLIKHNGLEKDEFGHQHFSLKTLLKWKQTMNRKKDEKDIKLIKKLLKPQKGAGNYYYNKYLKYKKKYNDINM